MVFRNFKDILSGPKHFAWWETPVPPRCRFVGVVKSLWLIFVSLVAFVVLLLIFVCGIPLLGHCLCSSSACALLCV